MCKCNFDVVWDIIVASRDVNKMYIAMVLKKSDQEYLGSRRINKQMANKKLSVAPDLSVNRNSHERPRSHTKFFIININLD
jgi:hypothetical protein